MSKQPIGCLGFVLRLFGSGRSGGPPVGEIPRVLVNKYFVSDAEADFFRVLLRVVSNRGHILAQVSLRQLLWFPGNNRSNAGRQIWSNRVSSRSVDFLVCDPATLTPLVAIELDEPTHSHPDRQTRDEQVESILEAAGLPLIRVLTSRHYDMRELENAIGPYIAIARS